MKEIMNNESNGNGIGNNGTNFITRFLLDHHMFSRNLSVLDFVRRFFVSCVQISEAYVDEIWVRLTENQPQKQV